MSTEPDVGELQKEVAKLRQELRILAECNYCKETSVNWQCEKHSAMHEKMKKYTKALQLISKDACTAGDSCNCGGCLAYEALEDEDNIQKKKLEESNDRIIRSYKRKR